MNKTILNKTGAALVRSLLLGTSALSAISIGIAHANPTGGTVAVGSATITNSGTTTTIDQKTGKVVINWGSFSIGSGSTVQFNQPNSSSIALNRVTGDQPTSIYGNLLANGQVWIINGNGVLFGKGSQINVGGLIATTADIDNNDFLSGDYSFNGATGASVVNQGTIRTKRGGSTVLSGANASNQGLISADTGTVVIGGAKAFTVDFEGDGLLKYAITAPATNAKASNSGTISAAGGHVIMTARAANSVQDAVVNNTGMISATSAKVGQDGEVVLDGGDGDVAVSGTIDVSGTASGTTGGSVTVTGRNVMVADGTTINASGPAGGGTVNIGGNLHGQGPLQHATNVTVGNATITADATQKGDGGQVVVWSDNDTSFAGTVSAKGGADGGNGGMVETSGHNLNVGASATVNTLAPKGKTGTWLLDPTNIFIVDGDQGTLDGNGNAPVGSGPTNDLLAPSTIVAALNTTDVSLQASNQIEVVSNINYSSSHTLSMLSEGNIIVVANVQNAGTGAINMIAGWDGTTTDPAHFTDAGVYGNNSGSITLQNDISGAGISGHSASVGSAGGVVTLAAAGLTLTTTDAPVQIGFEGAGGGDIVVRTTGDTTLDGRNGFTVTVGNGLPDGSGSGATTGNIDIEAGGTLDLGDDGGAVTNVWVGNIAGAGATETGNVTLIANSIGTNFDFSPIVTTDIVGGDVTLGVSGDTSDGSGFVYDSSHDLTILAGGNLEIANGIVNDGSGAITLVAGWDGQSLGLAALSQTGAYGNNDGVLTIGGSDSSGHMSVGSKSGTLTVLTGDLDVTAINGTTQLGFAGAGTGDINIHATGNVDVLGGDPTEDGAVAMIGNGTSTGFVDAQVGGNITIDAGGTINVESAGGTQPPGNGSGGFGEGGGSLCVDCAGELPPSGGGGALSSEGGGRPTVVIGNSMGTGNGSVSGDVTLTAFDLDDSADSNGGFNAIIVNDIVNGNVTIGMRDSSSFIELNRDLLYNSDHDLNILSAGGIGVDAVVRNDGSGNITLVAGWDGTTAASDIAFTTGSFGNNGGEVFLGDNCADCAYSTEIGTQFGTLSVYADTLIVDATDGYTQLGYYGGGSGNINVTVLDDVDVTAGAKTAFDAHIGNGGLDGDVRSDVSGDITITAGGTIDVENGDGGIGWIGNASSGDFTETGNVTLIASSLTMSNGNIMADLGDNFGNGGDVFIGIQAGEGGASFGGLDYNSPHSLTLASTGDLHVNNLIQNDGSGDVNLVGGWDGQSAGIGAVEDAGGWGFNDATVFIGGQAQTGNVSVGSESGSTLVLTDNLTIKPAGDLYGQLGYHGDGGGAITAIADGDITLEAGASGSQYAQIGNGSIENGQVEGPATGSIYMYAGGTLNLISDDNVGTDWIGNASDGGESGSVQIHAFDLGSTDNLPSMLLADVTGGDTFLGLRDSESTTTFDTAMEYNSDFALSLVSAGNLTVAADIVNFGSGQVSVVAGWDGFTVDPAQLNTSGAYGNNDATLTIGGANAAGETQVSSAGGFTLAAGSAVTIDAENGNAQIGFNGASTGNIEVDATSALTLETSTEQGNLLAQIGNGANGATGTFGGGIAINADSLTMTAGDQNDIVMIGNGGANTTGSYSGDITINVTNLVKMEAQSDGQFLQIGNGGSVASGPADGTITLNAGSLDMVSDAETVSSLVQIGNGGTSFTGFAQGDISVGVSGALTIDAFPGSPVWIGNLGGNVGSPDHAGDVTIIASSASGLDATVSDVLEGGDLTLGITGGDYDWDQALSYDSDHTFNLLVSGSITFDASLQNSDTGGLNIVAGWDGTTTDPALFGEGGVYGNNGGSVTIGGGLASGDVAVGTAQGQLNLYTDNLSLEADNGHAVLGYDSSFAGSAGAIGVNAIDTVTLTGSDDQNVFAQIGTSQSLGDNSAAGDVGIIAGSIQQSGTASIAADEADLTANDGDIGSSSANIAVASNSLFITTSGGDAYVTSPNMGINIGLIDMDGGDVFLSAGGPIAQSGAISAGHLEVETSGADNAITLDDTDNAFDTLTVDSGAGADIYDSSDLSVTSASVAEGATLTLASAGGITQTGVITADNFSVTSGTGDIVLDDSDNAINQLSVTTVGGRDATIFSNENLNLQTVSVDGTLTLNTTGAIEEGSSITAGALDATSGESGITLDNDDNDVAGEVVLNSGGDANFHDDTDILLGASTVTGTLTLVSAGGITQDGAIGAATLSVTANGGAIDLEDEDNAFGALNVTTTGNDDATFFDTGALDIASASVGGTLTVTTDGAITQDSAITAGALSVTSSENAITLDQTNEVGGEVTLNASADATFTNDGEITIGSADVGGTLTLTSGEGIAQDGAISATTLSLTAPGGVTLENTDNTFDTLDLSVQSEAAASIFDSTDLALDDIAIGGRLTLEAGGDVTQTSIALDVNGGLTVTSDGGAITLDNTANVVNGDVSLNAAFGDADFANGVGTSLGASTVGGTLTVNSAGALTQTGAISAGALDVTTPSGNDVTLDNDGNDVTGDVVLNSGGNATFHNDTDILLGASTVGGTLTLVSAGGITQDGAINAATLSATANGGAIDLEDQDNAFGALNVTTTGGDDATFFDNGALDIASASVGGLLTVTTDGEITQDGAITAAALTATSTDSGLDFNFNNLVSGDVSLNAATDATFYNENHLTLGASIVGGELSVTSTTGGIGQDGAISATTLSVTANGVISLTDPGNAFGALDVLSTAGFDATFVDTGDLDIASAEVDQATLAVTTDGRITQDSAITAAALSATSNDDSIVLDQSNAVSGDVSLDAADDATFTNAGRVTLGASTVGGTLEIHAGAGIGQGGAISADTLSLFTAADGIVLNDAGNSFNTLDVSSTDATAVSITDSTGVALDKFGIGGDFTLNAGGDVTQTANALSVTGALSVSTTGGDITLDNDANAVSGTVSLSGPNDVAFTNVNATTLGASAAGGTMTITAGGAITQSGGLTADTLSVLTISGAITLDSTKNHFDTLLVTTNGSDDATIVDSTDLTVQTAGVGGTLFLTADSIDQTGEIDANALGVIAANGITLTNTNNKFSGLEVSTTNTDAVIADGWGIDIFSANTGTGLLTLNSGGHVTQEDDAPITAGGLTVSAGEGGIVLNDNNEVTGDVSLNTAGDASFFNGPQITLSSSVVGGTLTLNSGGGIDQDGAFNAGTLTATAGEGTITLDNGDNNIGTVNLSTTSSADTSVASATGLTLGQITLGGKLIVAADGDIDQNQALVLGHGMDISSSEGGIDLSDTGNAVSGVVTLHSAGDATFANTLTSQIGDSATDGNLTLLSKGDVDVLGVVQSTSGNIVVVAGWDGETTDSESFGNNGVYGNNSGSLVIGGSGTTARAMLGAQSGATNVYAYNVNVLGTNADAQLGYHGAGGGDIGVVTLNDLSVTAGVGNALIGNGSFGTDVEGDVAGDIDLMIGGSATFADSTNKSAWLGNRTLSGTETGNVVLIAAGIDSSNGADIGQMAATDVVGGDVTIGGTGTEDASINGASYSYNSSHTLSLLTAGSLAIEGSIQNSGTGAINIVAGWDGQTLDGFDADGVAGNGGKGVTIGGSGATGNVAVGSFGGTTSVYGASLTLGAVNGYAQLGFNGAGTGAVVVDVSGNVALNGGAATGDFAQIGNGGRNTSGDNGGDIVIAAGGDVILTGGAGSEAYAQIGLGGAESNSNSTGYSNIGDIVVDATNVTVNAGAGTGAYAQIGNGGLKSGQNLNGNATDGGDIVVVATHAVSLLGNGDDGYAQIGNGGSQSNLNPSASATGTDSGTVTVTAPNGADGSVTLGAGAGANAYAQIGNGGYDMNAGASATAANFTVTGDVSVTDLALTGNGNNGYAQIGNGDVSDTGYGNVSGNIFIDANGNITYTNGTGTHSTATIGNFTGHGTTSGTVDGATPPDQGGGGDGGDNGSNVNSNPVTVGTIVTTQASNNQPNGSNPITVINTIVITIEGEANGGATGLTASIVDNQPPGPLASLDTGYSDSEPPTTADSATVVIADSLDGARQGSSTQSMLGGLLKQTNTPTGSHAVHAIPPADQDFSSWGNEALWQ